MIHQSCFKTETGFWVTYEWYISRGRSRARATGGTGIGGILLSAATHTSNPIQRGYEWHIGWWVWAMWQGPGRQSWCNTIMTHQSCLKQIYGEAYRLYMNDISVEDNREEWWRAWAAWQGPGQQSWYITCMRWYISEGWSRGAREWPGSDGRERAWQDTCEWCMNNV